MRDDYLKLYLKNKGELSFFLFVLLVLIYEKESEILNSICEDNFMVFATEIRELEKRNYVKWHGSKGEEISLRTKGELLFSNLSDTKPKIISDVVSWIDEWRNIFPEGINNVGFRYRGNKTEVLKKMLKFVTLYKYSKEEIFEATKVYVNRFRNTGFKYMQQAHYFIEKKDSGSTLASECENLRDSKNQFKQQDPNYGGKII